MSLHEQGGIPFMLPIDLLAILNSGLIVYLIFTLAVKKDVSDKLLDLVKNVGGLALAVGAFGTLVGLFQAFGAIEEAKDVIPFPVICGGLKVALITVLYGFIVHMLSMIAYISLKLIGSVKH